MLKPQLAGDVRYAAFLNNGTGLDAAVEAGLHIGVEALLRLVCVPDFLKGTRSPPLP